jgi:hypothetical protein
MVFNLLFGCIRPPEWKTKYPLDRRPHNVQRHRFLGGYGATHVLISVGNDIVMATNIMYYQKALVRDGFLTLSMELLTACLVLSAIVWLLQVVEGRCYCGAVRFSTILGFGILVQDIPQIFLTAWTDRIHDERILSFEGVINITTCVHSALTKIRALIDEDVEDERNYINSSDCLIVRPGIKEEQVSRLAAEI